VCQQQYKYKAVRGHTYIHVCAIMCAVCYAILETLLLVSKFHWVCVTRITLLLSPSDHQGDGGLPHEQSRPRGM
jgi:hypothetical protein